MSTDTTTTLSSWLKQKHCEPIVRVGIVLPEDNRDTLIVVPSDASFARCDADSLPLEAGSPITLRVNDQGVELSCAGSDPRTASAWSIGSNDEMVLERGKGILVKDVVAGRGFHWQKSLDQTFLGTIEVRRAGRYLLLVNSLPLEAYLAGVITAEMAGACPAALLESQAVVARSWLLAYTERKHTADEFDCCNDDCCQRYQGTGDLSEAAVAAVRNTRGEALCDVVGNVVDANYSKSCGGVSELPQHVWGVAKPGLESIVDVPADSRVRRELPLVGPALTRFIRDGETWAPAFCSPEFVSKDVFSRYLGRVDDVADYFRWEVSIGAEELLAHLRETVSEAVDARAVLDVRVTSRGVSGRANGMEIRLQDAKGEELSVYLDSEYRIRQALLPSFLFSSAIEIEIERNADNATAKRLTYFGAGWGHGVGFCQIGALGMALKDYDYKAILEHYFTAATLERVYD